MREAVALFKNMEEMQKAIKDLEATDFPRDSLSVLGEEKEVLERYGTAVVNPDQAEDDPDAPRGAPVRSEEKTIGVGVIVSASAYIGAMASALASGTSTFPDIILVALAGGIVGGGIGFIAARFLRNRAMKLTGEQIRKGGLLLWVRTADEVRENLACKILRNNGASHVRIHDI